MSAALQVFFKHCFCGEYSQRMRPTSGDVTTCPCTYTQIPIPMTDLDRDGEPRPKAEGTRDRFKGRSSVARPYATPRPVASIASRGEGFEALMAEQHDNPRITPSRSPSPVRGSARLRAARYGGRRRVHRRAAHPPAETVVLHSAPHILSDCPLVLIVYLRTTRFITYFGL